METEFSRRFAQYRKKTIDPGRGQCLTQERLAEELQKFSPLLESYSHVTISNWERGVSPIPKDNRDVLTTLVAVFHAYGGIDDLAEAKEWLYSGNYRELDEDEIGRINPDWLRTAQANRIDPLIESDPSSRFGLQEAGDRPAARAGFFKRFLERRKGSKSAWPTGDTVPYLYPIDCGEQGIHLDQQRMLVSSAFGAYFAGLLERPHNYIELKGQIDCPAGPGAETLHPLQRIYWALQHPRGPRVLVVASEGGMGKSTLAAKIVRCFYQAQGIDLMLGDSAKNERVRLDTAEVRELGPEVYDETSFTKKVAGQLGLPDEKYGQGGAEFVAAVRERLAGRRAFIIIDNLDTLNQADNLLKTLAQITNRDVRAILTTRSVSAIGAFPGANLTVHLRPISDASQAHRLLRWHVEHYAGEQPDLQRLQQELTPNRLETIIERTGGIPLLMQLLFNDVARNSWDCVTSLPTLFSQQLLDYLYETRWDELGNLGEAGRQARNILRWITLEQYRGRTVSFRRLADWAGREGDQSLLPLSMRQLQQRFLVLNSDDFGAGNYAIFPSLARFVSTKRQ